MRDGYLKCEWMEYLMKTCDDALETHLQPELIWTIRYDRECGRIYWGLIIVVFW